LKIIKKSPKKMTMAKSKKKTMTIKITPAHREIFEASKDGDLMRVNNALVEASRDPKRWFTSALEDGHPRCYGRGDTKGQAHANAEQSVKNYRAQKESYRISGKWTFIDYAPDVELP
jgi:hypothetical protein